MLNAVRFAALLSALTLVLACGSANDQQAVGGATASAAPAVSTMMPMDVASGTELRLILETPISSESVKPEQAVRARVAEAVVVAGMTVIAEGAPVTGTVVSVERSGGVKGRAVVALQFNEVTVADVPYRLDTARIVHEAEDGTIPAGAGLGTTIQATVRITAPM